MECNVNNRIPRTRIGAGILALAALAITLVWLLWPEPEPPAPRERAYLNSTACLLTDDQGIVGEQARAAWTGMQEASDQTRIKVQYLSVAGPQTAANASAYYNNLGLQKCRLIIAVGAAPIRAAEAGVGRFPDIQHAAVGGYPRNRMITRIDDSSPNSIRSATQKLVAASAHD